MLRRRPVMVMVAYFARVGKIVQRCAHGTLISGSIAEAENCLARFIDLSPNILAGRSRPIFGNFCDCERETKARASASLMTEPTVPHLGPVFGQWVFGIGRRRSG